MERTPLLRKTPLRRKTTLKVVGDSDTATIKRDIQYLAREIVIARDGGCILRDLHYDGIPECNGYTNDGQLVLQADHLITRSNSATFADTCLIVCVCKGHHSWKSLGSNARKKEYDELVRTLISPERVKLWDECERDSWRPHRTGIYDLKLALAALKQEWRQMQ
jgi:hypothetical protein